MVPDHAVKNIELASSYKYPSRLAKPAIVWLFRKSITNGILRLQFADETIEVGEGEVVCTIAPPTMFRLLWMLLSPDYRMPAQFTYGYWCCEAGRLYDFLWLLTAQRGAPLYAWFRIFNRNPIRDGFVYRLFPLKVKENIANHYNTSPQFMRLILGNHLEYTCAFFEGQSISLEQAQIKKINTVISRLNIQNGHQVLDMGCGWGQIAEHISSATKTHVTGLNITPNQIEYAKLNRTAQTDFVLSDYETFKPSKKFDRIYSIGMLEHIGRGKHKGYFSKVHELLADKGMALVHCIVRKEGGSTNSWIDKEIFPGAYIPELAEIIEIIEQSGLDIISIFSHDKSNYYKTLEAWSGNFYAQKDKLRSIIEREVDSSDADIILRIWEFYLCGSRLVFNETMGYCYNVQILLAKPKVFLPRR